MSATATPVERGCGTRVAGGIYAECGLSPVGRPVEDFLICPPIVVTSEQMARLGIKPLGVTLIERDGVTHVVDWIGHSHYPNVADFVEEARRFGASRRVPRTLDFARLTRDSRLLLIHAHAHLDNHRDYMRALQELLARSVKPCPKNVAGHGPVDIVPDTMCARLWWDDVAGGTVHDDMHTVTRVMPSFWYLARRAPLGIRGLYRPAFFMSLPISRLAVVRDPEGGSHEAAAEAASHSPLPVELVEE